MCDDSQQIGNRKIYNEQIVTGHKTKSTTQYFFKDLKNKNVEETFILCGK